ncbi:FAD-dependent oxidoreductase [Antrihabitans cavernicola]|uniref:FAD-dependent oxidoreductase n=1 Tax=Antrihabitans cavernicola TaxID=2495913 RepID=A0A5A7SAF7_9NOCA|nr:FAD-dependent oxidoreductase [Spelaeibacter cavernicola]KAA0022279.1 FAD-dependent oxidoreductase [Spelaeibacter cavernicola]
MTAFRPDRGRDRRRVLHPAPSGIPDAGCLYGHRRPHVVVVGAGIAGLSAATGLAERGVDVDIVEREPYIGGRVGGWTQTLPGGSVVGMNRGFHAFFRQYYNLRNLLRRNDPGLHRLIQLDDYPLIDAGGAVDRFRGLPRTPPWNALVFALRSPTFSLRDLAKLDSRAAAPLAAVSVPEIYEQLDHLDADRFLQNINFPAAARHLAFEVFSRSFFAEPTDLSAAELATMFHIYFLGSSEGLVFDVAEDNFDDLWAPLRRYLTDKGVHARTGTVRFHTRVSIASIDTAGSTAAFHLTDDTGAGIDADGVVLATDVAGLRTIVAGSPTIADHAWRERVQRMGTAPAFAVLRLWLDRPVATDRPGFLGTGNLEPLDNVSVVNHYEHSAAVWARRHGGSVVELHAYALPDEAQIGEGSVRLRRQLLGRLHALYPETATARIVDERLLFRRDCPRFAPGDHAQRPRVGTPEPGLALAGDGIRIDLPVALMERAATTGWAAANHLLARWGVAGHPLYTVPTQGRSALLRRVANRERRMHNEFA